MILKVETSQVISGLLNGPTTSGQKATERALVVDFHLAAHSTVNNNPFFQLLQPAVPTWNWKPGVKLTGIGPAAWFMGLNLQLKCQGLVDPPGHCPRSPDPRIRCAKNLHHRVCSNLVKMRRKGKFSWRKWFLSLNLKTGHECLLMVFFTGKEEELDKSSPARLTESCMKKLPYKRDEARQNTKRGVCLLLRL